MDTQPIVRSTVRIASACLAGISFPLVIGGILIGGELIGAWVYLRLGHTANPSSVPTHLQEQFLRGFQALSRSSIAAAETASNFGTLTVSTSGGGTSTSMQGYTQGAVPLATIALEDDAGNLCVGFAEAAPDHVLVVSDALDRLTIGVTSRGGDTTLLVSGADGRIVCGDDTGNSPDATVQLTNVTPGEYSVWVGTFDAGVRYDYTLNVY